MTNRTFTISLITTAWFLGAVFAFLFPLNFQTIFSLCGVFLFVFLMLSLAKNFKKNQSYRIGMLIVFSFLMGNLRFDLGDIRKEPVHKDQEISSTFLIHVLETGKSDFQTQNLVVECSSMERKGLIEATDFKFILRIRDLDEKIRIDDELVVDGELIPMKSLNNPGEFDAKWYYLTKGITHQLFAYSDQVVRFDHHQTLNGSFLTWRGMIAQKMEDHLDGDFLGVSKALILGDKTSLENDVMSSFSNTGSMHVLAVSGLHVGLLLYLLNFILLRFSKVFTKRKALFVSIILIWAYGLLTGASPAVMRAVFMFTIISFGGLIDRKSTGMISLMFTALLLSAWDPWVMFDIGFQLSFTAMLGIFLLYPKLEYLIVSQNKIVKWFWEGTAVGLAATAFTTPLTLYYFYQFPNYFLLANFGVMIFGFLVLLFGMIFLFTSYVPVVSTIAALVFSFTILGLLVWVKLIDDIPGAVSGGFHVPFWLLIVSLTIVFVYSLDYKKWKLKIPLAGAVLLVFLVFSFQRVNYFNRNELVFLNGKELVVVMRTPNGAVAFYEPRYGHANTAPRSLTDFQRYSGTKVKIVSLDYGIDCELGKNRLKISRARHGWNVVCNNVTYFYQTYGVPEIGPKTILNSKLQSFVDPDKEQNCRVIQI